MCNETNRDLLSEEDLNQTVQKFVNLSEMEKRAFLKEVPLRLLYDALGERIFDNEDFIKQILSVTQLKGSK